MGISNCNCLYVDSSTCLFNDFLCSFVFPLWQKKATGFLLSYICVPIFYNNIANTDYLCLFRLCQDSRRMVCVRRNVCDGNALHRGRAWGRIHNMFAELSAGNRQGGRTICHRTRMAGRFIRWSDGMWGRHKTKVAVQGPVEYGQRGWNRLCDHWFVLFRICCGCSRRQWDRYIRNCGLCERWAHAGLFGRISVFCNVVARRVFWRWILRRRVRDPS